MSARTALVTDSTSNLPPDLTDEKRIYVAPLYILWGEETYKDGVDISDVELFARLAVSRDMPKTSQVSPQDFIELFHKAREAEQADEIVCGVLSCDLSGTYASAMQAKDAVDFPVHVVDTRQTSWALGFCMLAAAEARDHGAAPHEIATVLQEAAQRVKLLFSVESLDYLYRGGRIGNASRLIGSALNIKPVLGLDEGVVETVDKVRTRKRVITHMVKVTAELGGNRPVNRVGVIHGESKADAEAVLALAKEHFNPQESYLSYATAVLGVHTGPGALGLIVEWSP